MNGRTFLTRLVLLGLVAGLVTGCTLKRPEAEQAMDIESVSAFSPPAVAQNGTVIRAEPATIPLNVGDTATVQIWIENVTDLYAVDLQISFDPEVIEIQDADPNEAGIQIEPGDFLAAEFLVENEADNVTGDIFYVVTQRAPTPPVSGAGVLLSISFRAIGLGNSALTFVQNQLVSAAGEFIPVTPQAGQIEVGPLITFTPTATLAPGEPTYTPTATFTPTPTLTPTPPPSQTPPTPT
jgi:hypothetical protein